MFHKDYGEVFEGDEHWKELAVPAGDLFSLGRRNPPTSSIRRTSRTCRSSPAPVRDIDGARVLAVLGDSITTDHISPAGSIKKDSPGGQVPDRARRRSRPTSTPTARAAATTR